MDSKSLNSLKSTSYKELDGDFLHENFDFEREAIRLEEKLIGSVGRKYSSGSMDTFDLLSSNYLEDIYDD